MSQDDQKQLSQKKETPMHGSKVGGFIKILQDIAKPLFNSVKDIVKLLFNSVVDMPQHTLQQQEQLKEMQQTKEGSEASGKSPEDLNQEEVEKAGKGLKEKMIKSSGTSDRSTKVESPGETPAKDVDKDSQKSIERQ